MNKLSPLGIYWFGNGRVEPKLVEKALSIEKFEVMPDDEEVEGKFDLTFDLFDDDSK